MDFERIKDLQCFEWDEGNADKIYRKHKVKPFECEEVFFDENKVIFKDVLHSGQEERYVLLGKNKKERLLFLVFTIRQRKVRIISARDTNKKERGLYEKTT
jgi:uncharacterized protein